MTKALGLDLASKKQRKRTDYPFILDYRTRWSDNDMFSHVNNPIINILVDSIVNHYLIKQCGYNTSDYPRIALVAHSYCDFFGSPAYPSVLDVGLRIVRLGKNSVLYEVGVFEQGSQDVKAVGGFAQIWVRRDTSRPPSEGLEPLVRKALEPLLIGSEQDPNLQPLSKL